MSDDNGNGTETKTRKPRTPRSPLKWMYSEDEANELWEFVADQPLMFKLDEATEWLKENAQKGIKYSLHRIMIDRKELRVREVTSFV